MKKTALLEECHNIAAFAGGEGGPRYVWGGIRYDPETNEVTATNGHILIIVPVGEGDEDGEIDGIEGPIIIPREALADALKSAAGVGIVMGMRGERIALKRQVRDLREMLVPPIDGAFPDTHAPLPSDDVTPLFSVRLQGQFLRMLGEYAERHAQDTDGYAAVRLSFYGDGKALRFDMTLRGSRKSVVGLVMPLDDHPDE